MAITPSGYIADGLDSIAGGTSSSDFIAAFNANFAKIMNSIYPIGSIYISTSSTSPATIFGGTWEAIEGRFLLSAGTIAEDGTTYTYTAGTTGGEATHALTVNEMPRHAHDLSARNAGVEQAGAGYHPAWVFDRGYTVSVYSEYTGGGQAHENMPPYLVVYVWKRIPDPEPTEE